MTTKLNWNERFALIDTYNPTDEQIVRAFNVTTAELSTARQLRSAGSLSASRDIDPSQYSNIFDGTTPAADATVTSTKRADVRTAPLTATKRTLAPKKRGRKGTKIQEAFKSIPAAPIAVEDFARQYGVSVPVLRQSKRFDTAPDLGTVRVKVSKETGKLMIWREPA